MYWLDYLSYCFKLKPCQTYSKLLFKYLTYSVKQYVTNLLKDRFR